MAVKPIPEGFHTVTPYLTVKGIPQLIKFMKEAFDAKELFKMDNPDGAVMHAEIKVGDSIIMMGEAGENHQPMPCSLYLYVEDADKVYDRAIKAGATSIMKPADQFYGDRNAGVKDSSGNTWWIGTHIEDVSPEEMEKRHEEYMKKSKK